MGKWSIILTIVLAVGLLNGCDPLTRHQITSTIFDGVPSMPPAEQYCMDFHQRALSEEREAEQRRNQPKETGSASVHPPYAEKRCNGCHDKNTESGFVAPRRELCFVCHKDFMKKYANFHGPAAVGDCLSCHLPHNSPNRKLLKAPRLEICNTCHIERRLAFGLHSTVKSRRIACVDCHNPHGGNARYFLE
jgi:predicted CXXCH cytochrome family protein